MNVAARTPRPRRAFPAKFLFAVILAALAFVAAPLASAIDGHAWAVVTAGSSDFDGADDEETDAGQLGRRFAGVFPASCALPPGARERFVHSERKSYILPPGNGPPANRA